GAGRIHVGDRGPEPLVDGDPVFDVEAGVGQERELGSHPDADDGKACAERVALVQLDRVESGTAAERSNLVAANDVDAALTVEADEVLRDLRRPELREQTPVT